MGKKNIKNSHKKTTYATRIVNNNNIHVRIGTGVIVINSEGKILLEKRKDNNMWGLPGGKIEPGETVLRTAKREIKEETGLNIKITEFLGIYSDTKAGRIVTYHGDDYKVHLVDVVFTAKIMSGNLRLSHESLYLKFFNKDDLPKKIVPPAIQPIQDYLTGKKGCFY